MQKKLAKFDINTKEVVAVFVFGESLTQAAVDTSDKRVPGFDYIVETEETGQASKGYIWHPELGKFSEPSPYPSWTIDAIAQWQPPTPKPGDDYDWNEETLTWDPVPVLIDINTADETALQTLAGVGPSTAAAIVLERNTNGLFSSLLSLSIRVDGVSPAMADGWTNVILSNAEEN